MRLLQVPCLCSDRLQTADRLLRCDATLQIDRKGGLTSSCDTRTDANLRDNYLSMSGSDPSHREVGRQTVSCITCPPPSRHPHTRAALISSAGHYPARLSAAQWSQTHSGSFQTLGGVVASRQSRAGHQIQPADRWFCTQNSRSHFPLSYILTHWQTGISHRVFGVDKEEL